MSKKIAEALFPHIQTDVAEMEGRYPPRKAACVTRFAPSPTGFMHIGGLYTALINCIVARQKQGVFLLRIEDTDQKRQLENGVSEIISTLRDFDIRFDEGPSSETEDYGMYGPYRQSLRREIYQTYAKYLVACGKAYPCFCTPEELQQLRQRQEEAGALQKGYWGPWARCRDLTEEEILANLAAQKPFVIRMRSTGREGVFRTIHDELRGDIIMQENILDTVIIKQDGLPTYHFAHVIDDHLMGSTDIIRADEWLSSLPVHVEMFETMGFPTPRYTHLSPIMKEEPKEDGAGLSKRKLSKRKDPEARVHYYDEIGYPVTAVLDYLLTISSAAYEPWRKENMDAPVTDFPMDVSKFSISGALFDFDKLNSVARNRVNHMAPEEIAQKVAAWAEENEPAFYALIQEDPQWFLRSIPLWHDNRLDVAKWSDLTAMYPYLYRRQPLCYSPLPEKLEPHRQRIPAILRAYQDSFDYADDSAAWFDKVRGIAGAFGYAVKTGLYKKHPEEYNGSIADVSGFIRYAITGQLNSPDLWQIIQLLGPEEAARRVEAFHASLQA